MRRLQSIALAAFVVAVCAAAHETKMADAQIESAARLVPHAELRATRLSPMDLEIAGELPGAPPGSTRYVTRDDLLALPQVAYTVSDDPNFTGPTRVSGVPLEEIMRYLGAAPTADLVVAISNDEYRTNYPRAYLTQHHPLLVLEVNGKPPSGWPKDSDGHRYDMGPYMISHPKFTPGSGPLGDEPQIPWGVVRLEFREERKVFGAIAPRGPRANDSETQVGYRIAEQNCFRCHNMGAEGGEKSKINWMVLSALAAGSPGVFASYVRNPRAKSSNAQMPGNPDYDEATLRALTTYFGTFSQRERP